jgi:hypothetical protein
MEKISEHLDFLKYREGKTEMSDVAMAKELIRDIGGSGHVSTVLYSAYTTLSRMFPHRDDPRQQWTTRRLKSWWNSETENVLHREMRELYEAARARKAEEELIREARNEHRKFIEKTTAIAALLERQDEAFHGAHLEALGEQLRRMGLPGTCRDD